MAHLSRVTNFFKDTLLGSNEILTAPEYSDGKNRPDVSTLMESVNGDLRESNNDGFEVIYKVSMTSALFILTK